MESHYLRFFELLELSPGASREALKVAYHRAAMKNHPDLFPERDRPRQQLRMMRINEAYLTLLASGSVGSQSGFASTNARGTGCDATEATDTANPRDAASAGPSASGAARTGAERRTGGDRAFESADATGTPASAGARDRGRRHDTADAAGNAADAGARDRGRRHDTADAAGNAADAGARDSEEDVPGTGSTALASPRDPAYTYYKLGFVFYRKGYTELFRKDAPGRPNQVATDLRQLHMQLLDVHTMDKFLLILTIRALQYFEQSYRYFLRVVEEYPESIWVHDARWKLRRLDTFNTIYHRICENLSRSIRESRARQASLSGSDG